MCGVLYYINVRVLMYSCTHTVMYQALSSYSIILESHPRTSYIVLMDFRTGGLTASFGIK